ncbi:MAG: phosphonate transporter ATP-binding protein [Mucilaginibacter sp.]|nr:phosphonate transporter ATP-binding protein [Mucilaginibacter sp.]
MRKKSFFCSFLLFSQIFLSFGQLKVTFKTGKVPAVKGHNVVLFLAGDFNSWNPGDKTAELLQNSDGSYQLIKTLPKGIYNFKITRGSWLAVECNVFGKPIDNRSIAVVHDTTVVMDVAEWQDNCKPEERKHTASANVNIIGDKFEIPQLGRQRRVWIYLPLDYRASRKRYPVIYMHDGQNLFDESTSGYGEWGIDEIMDKLPAKDQCIVVGIDHGGAYRITEYDPYDSKYGKGQGKEYVDFLVKTLKPYIDQHYRTKSAASHTTIAGSSMGGLISIYAAVKYPDIFGRAGIFSPALWIAPDLYGYVQQISLNRKLRFYFVCGDSESETMVKDMHKMANLIRSKGFNEKNASEVIIKGAKHNEKQWNGDFFEFYNWLLK